MSLQLILGTSGIGKTTWVNQYIIEESLKYPDKDYLIIVPEQFTMETQKSITLAHPNHGTANIDVLSFVRLAHKVFAEQGCEDYVVLDDMGKCVILQKAALKHADSLKFFGRNLKKQGFISELKSMLSELYQYGISPEQLESVKGRFPEHSILSGKLEDMITVYRAFAGELEEGTITAEEILPVMCKLLPKSEIIRDAVIVLDGFTGFTPVQYQVLSLLLQYSAKVMITITVDPLMEYRKEPAPHELFYLSCHTIKKILELTEELEISIDSDICIFRTEKERKIAWERYQKNSSRQQDKTTEGVPSNTEPVMLSSENNRFSATGELAFLEEHVLRFTNRRYQEFPQKCNRADNIHNNVGNSSKSQNCNNSNSTGSSSNGQSNNSNSISNNDNRNITALQIKVCRSPVEEVGEICDNIYQLVMKQGYRYREIAVITGNPEAYAPLFKQELERYMIPAFLDQKNSLMNNPLVEYIRGLFEIIIKDFSYESVFRFLKCGLDTCEREDRDYLENYVIACGIRGHKRWSEKWEKERKSGAETDFERLNHIREQVAVPLLQLKEAWKERGITVRKRIEILVAFLQEQKLEVQMKLLCDKFQLEGQLLKAKEYEQVYGLVMALLNEINTLMGEETLSLKDFSACFDSGLEEIKVGVIPASTDRLLVGDMERTRLTGVKVLFFAGVNEGQVPKNSSGGGIFTDYDKEQLLSCDIELSPTGRMSSFMDRFYLYLVLTKPSDRLLISYVKTDGNGKAMRPASCIAELTAMYPGLTIQDIEQQKKKISNNSSPVQIWNYLVESLSNPEQAMKNPVWLQIYCYFYQERKEDVERLLEAVADGYQPEVLTAQLARKLYGEALQASVSRLEQQAACAFSHFLRYGLKLKEREVFSFETADMGNLFHSALEKYFHTIKEEKMDITAVDEAKRKELVKTCVTEAARETGGEILGTTARNRWLTGKLERVTDLTVWALGEQMKNGGYETDGCEVTFEPDNTEAFTIPLTSELKMLLRGRIDRIDTKAEDDKLYVRIVDYKSGSRTFDLISVYYGLQIQLVFYMEAARENLKKKNRQMNIIPGGILYYNISNPIVERTPSMGDEDVRLAVLDKLQMNGMVTRSSLDEEERQVLEKKRGGKLAVVDDKQFAALQNYVHETVKTLGQQIMEGKIDVNPYVKGQISACTWCSYKSICGFDQKRRGYGYRNLAAMSKDAVWEQIMEEEEDEDGEQMDTTAGTGN